ncbi:MAG: hypothetical protein J6R04_00680 [Clostridia bacterium]|nr:hypothetical protein [Clostridia bacterium]
MLAFIIAVFAVFAAVLIIPATREVFESLSGNHPYLMGFVKFALLATAGELIAIKMASGKFSKPAYLIARIVIWGLIGIWITYMMKIFFLGSGAMIAAKLLPGSTLATDGVWYRLIRAFATAATMNLTFGPTFMAVHKCSDTYLALRAQNGKGVTLGEVIDAVDWKRFVSFTLFKTVPIFWIPAHTVTFMLPSEYQVMLAALLSVALGIILNLRKPSTKA